MIGPARSGLSAAIIMICQPAWQLPISTGLPSASGWRAATASMKSRLGAADVLDRLAGHWVWEEADEVAGMAGLQRDADLAVVLHAADARAMAGARINDDERPLGGIDARSGRGHDTHQRVVHRTLEGASVEQDLRSEAEHVGRQTCVVLPDDVPALVQYVQEQNQSLPSVEPVFWNWPEGAPAAPWNAEKERSGLSR